MEFLSSFGTELDEDDRIQRNVYVLARTAYMVITESRLLVDCTALVENTNLWSSGLGMWGLDRMMLVKYDDIDLIYKYFHISLNMRPFMYGMNRNNDNKFERPPLLVWRSS